MRRLFSRSLFFIPLLALAAASLIAAAGPTYFWPPATDVAIFKDGCAYVVRVGDVEPSPDGVLTEKVPRPVLGTLDVYSLTEGVKVGEVTAFYDEFDRTVKIDDLETFYRQQIGRRVAVEYGAEKAEGVLRAVLSGHLLIETGGNTVLVSLGNVTRLTLSGDAALEMPGHGSQARFRIRLVGAPRRARLGISYLEESWAWYPSYRVNLRPDGQAELVLAATVVNNAEDVKDAVLHLIVGVPNFMMRGTVSPMALDVDSGQIDKFYAPPMPAQMFTNRLLAQVAAEPSSADAYDPAAPGGAVEDLFVYDKKGFSLGRGERMQLELFRGTVPCASVYKWVVPLPDADRSYSQSYLQKADNRLQGEQGGEIWHFYRLANKTAIPWTTAPAMVIAGWQPVAQDLMKYVPVGGAHDLRATVAPDIRAKAAEEEISRQTVRLFGNDDYLRITVRGTLTLENFKKETVRMEIARHLWGEIKEAGGGKTARMAEYLWNVNPHSRLDWELELPPGKKTLTYSYDLYINI